MQIIRIVFLFFSISVISGEMPPYYGLSLSLYTGVKNSNNSFTFTKVEGWTLPTSNNTKKNVANLYSMLNGKFLISSESAKITIFPGEKNPYYFYWIDQPSSKYYFNISKEGDGIGLFTFIVSKGRPIFARSDNTENINQSQNNLFRDIYNFPRNITNNKTYFITKQQEAYVVFDFNYNGSIISIFSNWGDYRAQSAG